MAGRHPVDDDLRFPVLRESPPPPVLTMDQYDAWIEEESRHESNRAARQEALHRPLPTVPFVITD